MEDEFSKIEIAKIVKLKDAANFPIWKFQIDIILKVNGLYDIITGSEVKPETNATLKKEYEKRDAKAMKYIITTCKQTVIMHLMTCKDSKSMYSKLKASYERDSGQQKVTLLNRFYNFNIDANVDIQQQISELEFLAHRIQGLGEQISETMIITKVLSALPAHYSYFFSAWESTSAADRTLSNLTARLADEQIKMKGGFNQEQPVQQPMFKMERQGSTSRNTGAGSKPKCYTCGKIGHKSPQCMSKQERMHCTICKKDNHNESSCYFRRKDDKKTYLCTNTNMVSSGSEKINNSYWILDSGSSQMLTGDLSILSNV